MRNYPIHLIVITLVALFCVGGVKKTSVSIQVYAVASSSDTGVKRMALSIENAPSEVMVQKQPVFSQKDIVAFYPFVAHDGSVGVYFQLDGGSSELLKELTITRQNTYVIAVINQRPVCMLLIDRPVTDGLIVIPNGITKEQRFELGQQFPLINETIPQTKQRREVERREARENEKRN